MSRKILFCITAFLFLLFPMSASAVDFSIPDVKIDAYLKEDGNVQVQEQYIYQFSSKFNGITREIFPKNGAEITDFLAKEGGKALRVETDDKLYKVHRKGKKEKVEITLEYVIKNGVEKFEDVTQFYWPFFDDRNETDYGNMEVTVHPPKPTDDIIAVGYDQAFDTQMVKEEGVVTYSLGYVPAGENADVRVAYPSELFPGMNITSAISKRDSLLQEKKQLEAKVQKFLENKQAFASLSNLLIPISLLIFIILFGWEYLQRKRKYNLVKRDLQRDSTLIPSEKLSMPATIYYTLGESAVHVPTALLDLVRKGNVEQVTEDKFKRIHSNVNHKHEEIILSWLFDELGEGNYFHVKDLEKYTEDEKNLPAYQKRLTEWKWAIKEEIKEAALREHKSIYRISLGILSVGELVLGIIAIYYEVIPMFVTALLFFIIAGITAIFYRPFSSRGLYIKEEWSRFAGRLNILKSSDWRKLSDNDRMKAIVFGTNKSFIKEGKMQKWQEELHHLDASYMGYSYLTIPLLYGSFSQADQRYLNYSESSSGNSYGGAGGGGVGGGGGGSGAF